MDSQDDGSNNATVTATDNAGNQTVTAGTNNYTIDTILPTGLTALVDNLTGSTSQQLTWTEVTETSFDHYEIWFGTSQTDVQNRTAGVGADEWDENDVANLGTKSQTITVILPLSSSTTYFFKIWAIDDVGNEETVADINTTTAATNIAPVVTTAAAITQATDGSGEVTFTTTISDADSDDTKLRVAYSENGGTDFFKAFLKSATPSAGTIDIDNTKNFQIGDPDIIDTSGGSITLTVVWDTQSSSNENGSLDDTDQSDIVIRLLPNDLIDIGTPADSSTFTLDNLDPTVTDGNISIAGGSGTGGAFIVGDTVTATWNDSAGGDNNTDTITSRTANLSEFGGGAAVTMTDTTACGGDASDDIYEACYTITGSEGIDATNQNASVTAVDDVGNSTTTADTANATVDTVVPIISVAGVMTLTSDVGLDGIASIGDQVTFTVGTPGSADGDSWSVDLSPYGLSSTQAPGAVTIIADNDDGTFTATETITDNAGNTASGSSTITGFTDVDNLAPSGLTALIDGGSGIVRQILNWSTVTETSFDHYEIWFGTVQGDVQERTGTATEWDDADDTALATRTTATTTITGLSSGTTYFYKAFAQDDAKNEETVVDINITTASAEQSGYRFFNNVDSAEAGSPLAAQDTAATLSSNGDAFRLRTLTHVGASNLSTSGENFKLQFATRSGTCDTSFTGETYADVTGATAIQFNDNASVSDGATLTALGGDPTHGGDTIVNQTYEELNNFTNSVSAINAGQDGKWDFSLIDNDGASPIAYCFRIVKSDGSLLDTYSVIPEVTTASGNAAPTGSFNSAVQKTDGTGLVDVSIEVDDANDDDTKVKIEYETDSDGGCGGPWANATLVGPATADFDDSGGAPDVNNGNTYQVGTTATTRVITSSGSNTIQFDWDSNTDLPSADGNQCLRITVNDDTVDQTSPATITPFNVDNVNPAVTAGNISVSNTGSGTGGAFIPTDIVTVTWDDSAATGDGNTDTILSRTADLSDWGGSSTATMTDTTACGGSAGNDIYEACLTLVSGSIDVTDAQASISVTDDAGNATTTADGSTFTVDTGTPGGTISALTPSTVTSQVGDTVTLTVTEGASETGLTLSGTINGVTGTNAVDNGDGTYTIDYVITAEETAVASGELAASLTFTDAAGNVSPVMTALPANTLIINTTLIVTVTGVPAEQTGGTVSSTVFNPPTPPEPIVIVIEEGGFGVSINNGARTTLSRNVTLILRAGSDTERIALSNTPDFESALQEQALETKAWDLCSGTICVDGVYTVYVKFFTQFGVASEVVSDSITLTQVDIEPLFTTSLQRGDRGPEVTRLQQLLATDPTIYPEGIVTGFYGSLTELAVGRFQIKYGVLLGPSSPGYGRVGPRTRAKLSEVFGQ